ncbi:hypothetical protein [Sphingobium sp. EP60837]|nr:hypothetical protein [Sphingobium sp. EP60837]ANI79588.1 hypothetical protein EP837_03202 [Sphingobium sp. EP60837]
MDDPHDTLELAQMRDDELIRAWCSCEDHEHLSPESQALIQEMERRDLEF